MAVKTIDDTILTDIADAIREKSRTEETYYPHSMAQAILSLNNRLQNKTVKSTQQEQTIQAGSGYDGIGTVTVQPFKLESKSVILSEDEQTITPSNSYDALSSITVPWVRLRELTVTPSNLKRVIIPNPERITGWNKVTVNTDENLKSENIKDGVTIFGVTGSLIPDQGGTPEAILQQKTVTPTSQEQVIEPDDGYDGLSQVVVNPIPSNYGLVTYNGSNLRIS